MYNFTGLKFIVLTLFFVLGFFISNNANADILIQGTGTTTSANSTGWSEHKSVASCDDVPNFYINTVSLPIKLTNVGSAIVRASIILSGINSITYNAITDYTVNDNVNFVTFVFNFDNLNFNVLCRANNTIPTDFSFRFETITPVV